MRASQLPLSLFILSLAACGGGSDEGGSDNSTPPTTATNQAPTVVINPVSDAKKGQPLTLSADATDSDGTIASYQWRQVSGPSLSLSNLNESELTLTPVLTGHFNQDQYTLSVDVVDNDGASASHSISFSARNAMTQAQASHLLRQSTMGVTGEDINNAVGLAETQWLEAQFNAPMTLHEPLLMDFLDADEPYQISRIDAWWKATLHGEDQLRQRVAFALSEIFVVSDKNNGLREYPQAMLHYYDILVKHAFGNYRDLLEEVTLSPVMGVYLSHLGNEKPDAERNIRPDENYAREVMQLFSIGLEELNLDGTPKRDGNNQTIATYGQDEIEGFAHIFTGWTYADSERWYRPSRNFLKPMEAWPAFHADGTKQLLRGEVVNAGQTPEQDLNQALDNLFNHPNVGPFMAFRLIQRLTTSNPTPGYVARVASVFNDNGEGVRGDLKATVAAILLDPEARQVAPFTYFGRIKEPLLITAQLWRELNAASSEDVYYTWSLSENHGQAPLNSPSVFNFFSPTHIPQSLVSEGLFAPELQILDDATLVNQFNHLFSALAWSIDELKDRPHRWHVMVKLAPHVTKLEQQGVDALLDYYDTVFFAGNMSIEMRQELLSLQQALNGADAHYQVAYMLFLITTSAQYRLEG